MSLVNELNCPLRRSGPPIWVETAFRPLSDSSACRYVLSSRAAPWSFAVESTAVNPSILRECFAESKTFESFLQQVIQVGAVELHARAQKEKTSKIPYTEPLEWCRLAKPESGTWGICTRRADELQRSRSSLYPSRF